MKKNVLALLLAMAMLLGLMAGCGSSAASGAAVEESKASAAEAPAEEEAAPAEEAPAEEEAAPAEEASAGEEAAPEEVPAVEIEYPICEPGEVTLTYWMQWPPFLNGTYEPADVPFFAAMEEATGVALDVIYCSTEVVQDQLQLLAASDSFYDLMQGCATNYPGGGTKAIEEEMIVDILPLMPENMPNYWAYMQDPAVSKQVINDQGYVPMLSGIYTDYYYTDQGFWVRQDWLDELNIEKPETLDQFTDMLKTFKSEKGATDALTVLSAGTVNALSATFNTNMGGVIILDGEANYGDITDGGREYLRYLNSLYNDGLISSDFTSYTESDTKPPQDIVLNGMTGVFNEDVMSVTSYTNAIEGMDLRALPAPVQNAGEKLSTSPFPALVSSQYNISVSTNCENIETALQYIDYLFTEEGCTLANYGTEGVTYTVENGTPTFTDAILNDPMGFQIGLLINICPGFIRMIDWDVTYLTYNDAQKEAVDIWMTAYGSTDSTFPQDYVTYTTEESETISDLESEIGTYCEENRLKFIIGAQDINDDEAWNTYVSQVESMGIAELLEVYQNAYDRYMAK